ncbi:cytochrome b [Mycobacterium deserti]|uniref:Cytochrome b/b6 domain-containing protein n=1 Tax=Mycobacterium deserti TaxID=2978347 RepID=A0ABT2MGT0_9MYCO|nr:cytochrome b/b6 domain-containing protein [Mycobacterium deserti]MCT7661472.1 cytochrome b/b6 domain-containing protein [Mycobacterium deserti]
MRMRNGEHGYGVVTKTLHWLTVAAVAAQFGVGLTMKADDAVLDLEKDRIEQFEELVEGQGDAAEEMFEGEIERMEEALDAREDAFDDDYLTAAFSEPGVTLPEVHVLLGVSIMLLGILRVLWRSSTPLPPWAEHLSAGERRWEGLLEKALLTSLLVVPATGLLLLAVGNDWLTLHVAAQLVFLAAIVLHVGLVLKHTLVHRHRHLARML